MADESNSTPEIPAAAPPPETPAPEKPAEGEKPPEPVKSAERLAAHLARRANKVKAREAAFEQAKSEFTAQSQALQGQLKELAGMRELFGLAKSDPLAFLSKAGVDLDSVTQAALRAGSPDEKLAALEKKLAEREAADARAKQEAEQRQRAEQEAAQHAAIAKQFLAVAKNGSYPELEVYEDAEIVAAADAIAPQLAQELGRPPRFAEVAAFIDKKVAERHERIEKARAERKAKAEKKEDSKDKKEPSQTLKNKDGTETTGTERELTWEERRKIGAEILRNQFSLRASPGRRQPPAAVKSAKRCPLTRSQSQ